MLQHIGSCEIDMLKHNLLAQGVGIETQYWYNAKQATGLWGDGKSDMITVTIEESQALLPVLIADLKPARSKE